jgi:hypothetical protein
MLFNNMQLIPWDSWHRIRSFRHGPGWPLRKLVCFCRSCLRRTCRWRSSRWLICELSEAFAELRHRDFALFWPRPRQAGWRCSFCREQPEMILNNFSILQLLLKLFFLKFSFQLFSVSFYFYDNSDFWMIILAF